MRSVFPVTWLSVLIILLVSLALSLRYGGSDCRIGMAFSFAPILALIVFGVISALIHRSWNRFGTKDAIRLILWTLMAFAEGVRQMSGGFYRHFHPREAGIAWNASLVTIAMSLVGIIVVSTALHGNRAERGANDQC